MEQLNLVQDVTLSPHFEAAKLDVKAIGGFQPAAKLVYPDDEDPKNAAKKLSNLLNGNPNCKPLSLEQWQALKEGACIKAGRSHLVEYELSRLPIRHKWVAKKVLAQRAERRIADLLTQVQSSVEELKKWSTK
jgi:hypothetical protein